MNVLSDLGELILIFLPLKVFPSFFSTLEFLFYFYSLIFKWSSMFQKHLVEKTICLAFSSFGFRNPMLYGFLNMDQKQKRCLS